MANPKLRNPYDFVPLEGAPVHSGPSERATQEGLKAGLHSGRIVCRLHTETPLYIHDEGAQQAGGGRRRFCRRGNTLTIPAAALKGMVRAVASVVADGCLGSDKWATSKNVPAGYEPCQRTDSCCPVCALFGMVERRRGEESAKPLAGRVSFGPATPFQNVKTVSIQIPRPRGGPKPHHSAFYFDPQGHLLGRKFYYHHGPAYRRSIRQAFENLGSARPTALEAVEGTLCFEVRFTNLTDDELGLLVYALALEPDLRHHLGYAKPYGLGTVRVEVSSLELEPFEQEGPVRFLAYDVPQLQAADPESWREAGLAAWKRRPTHAQSYASFKDVLHWPRNEAFAYPTALWFCQQRSEKVRVTLSQYQKGVRVAPSKATRSSVSSSASSNRQRGVVNRFDPRKGYGFIDVDGGWQVFVHRSDLQGGESLSAGDRVEFGVRPTPRGLCKAVDVVRLGRKP